MDLSSVLDVLKPVLATEGKKLVDGVVIPEIESLVKSKITDPIFQALLLSLLPAIKATLDSELDSLLK